LHILSEVSDIFEEDTVSNCHCVVTSITTNHMRFYDIAVYLCQN